MPATLALALLQAALLPAAQTCTGGLCDAERLRPFLTRLAHARTARRPVRIVQIGDSHTAGDQITGSWRTMLQIRHGSGGRGLLPPGRPYAGYLTRGITAAQSAGWTVNGIFGSGYAGPSAPAIGLSGYSLSTTLPGATISLTADSDQLFDRFTVCALRRPGGGTVTLRAGTTTVQWSLDAADEEPDCKTVDTDMPVATAAVTAMAGPVTVTSWATERTDQGGVILSNLGTVGAQLVHFGRTNDRVVARELREYRPDLIVVAFGTNEAFRPGFAAAAYDADLGAQIARVRRLVGDDVPILLLGAPDSATRTATLQSGVTGSVASCPSGVGTVEPLRAGVSSPWQPTAALSMVQAIQRRRAHMAGLAYWDWSQRMGGRCTAHRWTQGTVPMMRGDHVHFTTAGGAAIARLLQADIDAATIADPLDTPR